MREKEGGIRSGGRGFLDYVTTYLVIIKTVG